MRGTAIRMVGRMVSKSSASRGTERAYAFALRLQLRLCGQPCVDMRQARFAVRRDLVQADETLDATQVPNHCPQVLPLRGGLEQNHFDLRVVDDIGDIVRPVLE